MSTTGKDERIAQILETGVTREQLAEVVWSMERDYAGHVELIKELMDERAALRSENARLRELCAGLWLKLDIATQYDAGGVRGVVYEFADFMRELGVEP